MPAQGGAKSPERAPTPPGRFSDVPTWNSGAAREAFNAEATEGDCSDDDNQSHIIASDEQPRPSTALSQRSDKGRAIDEDDNQPIGRGKRFAVANPVGMIDAGESQVIARGVVSSPPPENTEGGKSRNARRQRSTAPQATLETAMFESEQPSLSAAAGGVELEQ
jgi:hypothetical protein